MTWVTDLITKTIQRAGEVLPLRRTLNFKSGFDVQDNPSAQSTDVSVTAVRQVQAEDVTLPARPTLSFGTGTVAIDDEENQRTIVRASGKEVSGETGPVLQRAKLHFGSGFSVEDDEANERTEVNTTGKQILSSGTPLAEQRGKLDFGDGFQVSDNPTEESTQLTLGLIVEQNGSEVARRPTLNLTGGLSATDDAANNRVTLSGGVSLQNDGTPLPQRGTINFTGGLQTNDTGTRIDVIGTNTGATVVQNDDDPPNPERATLNFRDGLSVTDNAGQDRSEVRWTGLTVSNEVPASFQQREVHFLGDVPLSVTGNRIDVDLSGFAKQSDVATRAWVTVERLWTDGYLLPMGDLVVLLDGDRVVVSDASGLLTCGSTTTGPITNNDTSSRHVFISGHIELENSTGGIAHPRLSFRKNSSVLLRTVDTASIAELERAQLVFGFTVTLGAGEYLWPYIEAATDDWALVNLYLRAESVPI